MIYGLRERELILAFFEKTAGLRLNLNYVRPGGVAADLPDGWQDDVLVICDTIYERTYEYDQLLTGQPIFRQRLIGVAPMTAEEALALCVTGPLLRSTGVPWDLRRTMPTSPTTRSSSTSSWAPMATTSPLRHSSQRDSRINPHRAPVHRHDAQGGLPQPGPPRSRRRHARASASQWKR